MTGFDVDEIKHEIVCKAGKCFFPAVGTTILSKVIHEHTHEEPRTLQPAIEAQFPILVVSHGINRPSRSPKDPFPILKERSVARLRPWQLQACYGGTAPSGRNDRL